MGKLDYYGKNGSITIPRILSLSNKNDIANPKTVNARRIIKIHFIFDDDFGFISSFEMEGSFVDEGSGEKPLEIRDAASLTSAGV